MMRPRYVFIMCMLVATMYSGIIIASNGIIIVAMIDIKMRFRDLNLNFARP